MTDREINQTKKCFVIAPIGEEESEVRKRSDKILKHVITPSVGECGYEVIRADKISEPGMITNQVIQHILDDELIVADLTGYNPNVFYELAICHSYQRPLVQLIRLGEQIPFDIADTRTIHINHEDLDSANDAKLNMIAQIKSIEDTHSKSDSPISVALGLRRLQQSGNPEEQSLADVLSRITELHTTVSGLANRLSDPSSIITPAYVRAIVSETRRIPHSLFARVREIYHEVSEVRKSYRSLHGEDQSNLLTDDIHDRLEKIQSDIASLVYRLQESAEP